MFGWKNGKGAVIIGGEHKADTLQCVHCGCHWLPKPGSGTVRGWCSSCKGPVCGKEPCNTCIPFEASLEIQEGTLNKGKYFEAYLRQLDKK